MSRSNKEARLTHSGKTVATGHGGMKRNRVAADINDRDPREPRLPNERRMDPFTRASQELMRRPRAWYGETTGRWHATRDLDQDRTDQAMEDTQGQIQEDAQEQINQRTRSSIQGREGGSLGGGGGFSGGGGGGYTSPFSFGGGGGGRRRGVVKVIDIK